MKYEEEASTLFSGRYGLSEVLPRFLKSVGQWAQSSKGDCEGDDPASNNDESEGITGHDWLHVEELHGLFYTTSRLRRECIVMDQPQHRLWCQQSKESMQLRHISFVIPIEDTSAQPSWKVLVQDPKQYQEWAIYFPEKAKMMQWVDLLRKVMESTGCSGVVRACVQLITTNN